MKRPFIKDYKKDGNMWVHKETKQNFEFDMSKYLNILYSEYYSKITKAESQIEKLKQENKSLKDIIKSIKDKLFGLSAIEI